MCEKEGYDWRLISAIAYSESRFNPYVVSRKGAKGLMQVMPRVARQFGVQGDLMDPENNVLLALKVLGKIEKSLDFAPGTSSADRMKIVLACYNAGLGHVLDARSLARKYGANPDSWSDVSTYLSLKSDPEVVKDDAVKCGRFNRLADARFREQGLFEVHDLLQQHQPVSSPAAVRFAVSVFAFPLLHQGYDSCFSGETMHEPVPDFRTKP